MMKAFKNAEKFFRACEAPEGWAGCREYVANGTSYDLHVACFDEATRTAVFFVTYDAKHAGEPGPDRPRRRKRTPTTPTSRRWMTTTRSRA